jgi:Tfp pilus assembly protein PilN
MSQAKLISWLEPTQQKTVHFAIISMGSLLVTFCVLIILHFYMSSVLRHQQERNQYLQEQLSQIEADLGTIEQKRTARPTTQLHAHRVFKMPLELLYDK